LDTFSHALWGKALFGYRGAKFSPFLFGVAPDLIAFVPFTIFKLFKNSSGKILGRPEIVEIPDWVFYLYDFSHSFITSFLLIAVLLYFKKKILAFAALSWSFHILLDFPFHSKEFFPTKIFWPISDVYLDGISWATPEVWLTNVLFLTLFFFYRFYPGKDLKM
jgi:membrane-bound metal-dependent hydrolase YbcI (DUF457 family)